MDFQTLPVLLVTANVGSIFEDPQDMLKLWTQEFLSVVARLQPKFVALHCQEVGGKNYEKSMKHVQDFVSLLSDSDELRLFDKVRVFLDEDYSSAENFTALGNLYFVHESITDVLLWNFKDAKFIPVEDKEIHSGNIESVVSKEKAKFPQNFFPECKWSRKGFLRTRWSVCGTVFDLVNIHLFHDASNFVAMEAFPSVYSKNRQRALEYTLQRFHNDAHGKVPYFLFGDFNFRTDTDGVIKKLTKGLTFNKVQSTKNGDHTKLHYTDENSEPVLIIGKKEFNHYDHKNVFIDDTDNWLRDYDKEIESFDKHIMEYPICFPPSYPFEEKIMEANSYMQTRCPAWCDRVLLSHTAAKLVSDDKSPEYNLMGQNTCMGDHKPVFLYLEMVKNAGTVCCCLHAPYECLPMLCQCCQLFASVTINVTDMSSYLVSPKDSFDNVVVDSNFLHEPITRDMLLHDPYTPESCDSHSPKVESLLQEEDSAQSDTRTHSSVSPQELKTKLEDILRLENAKSEKFLLKRSTSQSLATKRRADCEFRERSMSEVPKSSRFDQFDRFDSHQFGPADENYFELDDILETKSDTSAKPQEPDAKSDQCMQKIKACCTVV